MTQLDLEIATQSVTDFVETLFDADQWVEVRAIRGRGKVQRLCVTAGALVETVPNLWKLNQDGYNIYVGIVPRKTQKGSKEADCCDPAVIFVDKDNAKYLEPLILKVEQEGLSSPTLTVGSGNGYHLYWRLDHSIERLEWAKYMLGAIAACESDPSVKDLPRIMRLPGFYNCKDPDDLKPAVIIGKFSSGYVFETPEDAGFEQMEIPDPAIGHYHSSSNERQELNGSTCHFILRGAPEGTRNQRLFGAACDFSSKGYTDEEAMTHLFRGANKCGMDHDEFAETIGNAYSEAREVRLDPGDGLTLEEEVIRAAVGKEAEHVLNAVKVAKEDRPKLMNAIPKTEEKSDGKTKHWNEYVPAPLICKSLRLAMGGFPKSIGGMLMAIDSGHESDSTNPNDILFIKTAPEFWGWVTKSCDLFWSDGRTPMHDKGVKTTPVNRSDFYHSIQHTLRSGQEGHYDAVELLPHWPAVENTYYAPCKLPDPTGKALEEFVAHLCPATEMDMKLMIAALVTPGWGGACGKRPAFVFTSDHGRGSGKSATANLMSRVWGGGIFVNEKEKWKEVLERLLGDDSLSRRIIVVDNIKREMSSGGMEGLMTAPVIDGRKMYYGQYSRPNRLTWYMTANTPTLSRDLAQRAVQIKIGKVDHSSGFEVWQEQFFRDKHLQLLADIMSFLQTEPKSMLLPQNRDRWAIWQDAILTKFENCDEVAEHIANERPKMDNDGEIAEDIETALLKLIVTGSAFNDPFDGVYSISNEAFHYALEMEGLSLRGRTRSQVMGWVRGFADVEPLKSRFAKDPSRKHGRRILYSTDGLEDQSRVASDKKRVPMPPADTAWPEDRPDKSGTGQDDIPL